MWGRSTVRAAGTAIRDSYRRETPRSVSRIAPPLFSVFSQISTCSAPRLARYRSRSVARPARIRATAVLASLRIAPCPAPPVSRANRARPDPPSEPSPYRPHRLSAPPAVRSQAGRLPAASGRLAAALGSLRIALGRRAPPALRRSPHPSICLVRTALGACLVPSARRAPPSLVLPGSDGAAARSGSRRPPTAHPTFLHRKQRKDRFGSDLEPHRPDRSTHTVLVF